MHQIIFSPLCIILFGTVVNAWIFPDPLLVDNVAKRFDRNGVMFHFPNLLKGNVAGYLEN